MQVCDSSSVIRVCRNGKALIAFYWQLYLSHHFPVAVVGEVVGFVVGVVVIWVVAKVVGLVVTVVVSVCSEVHEASKTVASIRQLIINVMLLFI